MPRAISSASPRPQTPTGYLKTNQTKWLKNPNESQLQLLLDIMLALNDGSYVLGDAGESYHVKEGAVVYNEPPATETPSGWRSKALQFRYSWGLNITLLILFVLLQVILHRIDWL